MILPNVGDVGAGSRRGRDRVGQSGDEPVHPVSGEIIAVNTALRDTPTLANTDPLGAGWFFRVKLSNPGQLDALLDEKAYAELFWAP